MPFDKQSSLPGVRGQIETQSGRKHSTPGNIQWLKQIPLVSQLQARRWEMLRVGGSLNFFVKPEEHLANNGAMMTEQMEISIQFVEEYFKLDVLEENPSNDSVFAICPLSVVCLTQCGASWPMAKSAPQRVIPLCLHQLIMF